MGKKWIENFFLKTNRIGFSKWMRDDLELAKLLWGNPAVTRYICVNGVFDIHEIINRMNTENQNESLYQVQYWPIFELATNDFIGCCGLRPYKTDECEIGLHLRPEFWGRGCAAESANAVIKYAFILVTNFMSQLAYIIHPMSWDMEYHIHKF